MKNVSFKYFMTSFLVLVIVVIVPLYFFYQYKINTTFESYKKQENYVVNLQKTTIENNLKSIIDDVLLLAEHVRFDGYNGFNEMVSDNKGKNFESEFKAFSIGKYRKYDQLRFIDEEGNERVRINFNNNIAHLVEQEDLQNKSHRYYFKVISKLKKNEVYISPLDLNIEHNEIERPLKPMLRIGTPLFNEKNQFKGLVMINYLGSNIISAFNNINSQSAGFNMLINENGDWLVNTHKQSFEWLFMLDTTQNIRFSNYFPDSWDEVSKQNNGQVKCDSGLFTFQTIYPIPEREDNYAPVGEAEKHVSFITSSDYFWKVISFLPNSTLHALLLPIKQERNYFTAILLLLILGISIVYSIVKNKEAKAKLALKSLNKQLEEKVRERTEKYLIEKQKAEENDKLKTAFLNNMSHEIRTPLNAIVGFANLMENYFDDKEKLSHFTQIITKRSNDLTRIISDILDISKIESRQLIIKEEECVLYDEISDLHTYFEEYKAQINKSEIQIYFTPQCEALYKLVVADAGKLKQVLSNLINNALKFTDKGKIEITCTETNENLLLFSVSDTGRGIAKEQQELVFNRFTQIEPEKYIKNTGTGLGLSIVKGIIDLMGAKIWMESEPGKGSTFYFTFPFKQIQEKDLKRNKPKIISEKQNSYHILVVEDDTINREYIKEVFADTKHKLSFAEYGEKAFEMFKNDHYDIVLMDIRLPDINGFEVTKKIRRINKDVRIIAQTAYASVDDKQKAMQSGCNDFIAKPLNKELLFEKIKIA